MLKLFVIGSTVAMGAVFLDAVIPSTNVRALDVALSISMGGILLVLASKTVGL